MSASLILAALHRHSAPLTATELHDLVVAVALDAGWPKRAWADLSPRKIAALLRGMEARGEVIRAGEAPENGRLVPRWGLEAYDATTPFPPPDLAEADEHPLHGMTRRQQFVLFDALDANLAAYTRMQRETTELVARHNRELADLAARTKRELMAVGLEA